MGRSGRGVMAVLAIIKAANINNKNQKSKKIFGQVFNIGNNKNLSVNYVVQEILKETTPNIKPKHLPPVIEPHDTLANNTKAKTLLNWQPKHDFKTGIKQTIKWFSDEMK